MGSEHALARGDYSEAEDFVEEVLAQFRIRLDPKSPAYKKLSIAVLQQHVRAVDALGKRHKGAFIETPNAPAPDLERTRAPSGEALSAALAGWAKGRNPAPSTIREFSHAVARFIELHGDMPVVQISRTHVRQFREALQDIPVRRVGKLRTATLPDIVKWSRDNPAAPRVSEGTVNKLLGGVQAVVVWARDNGLISDDVPWADPFSNMRLEVPEPDREPWEVEELNMLFSSPVYTAGANPKGGGGKAAYWLPLLGLFTGARLGELAPLRTSDVMTDATTKVLYISISEDTTKNKRLKTASSRRIVPVHPELIRLGFPKLVNSVGGKNKIDAPLFPELKPGSRGGVGEAWSKWFSRYIRSIGITNTTHVFHSFRHSFKDALRASGAGEDINDALTGHSNASVGRRYGAKDVVRRFGLKRLAEVVAAVHYPGLELQTMGGQNGNIGSSKV